MLAPLSGSGKASPDQRLMLTPLDGRIGSLSKSDSIVSAF
jgi:hypothetical protein